MEFVTPPQPHHISVSVTIKFDNADPFPIPPDMQMFEYGVDPTVYEVDPKTAIIRSDQSCIYSLYYLVHT